MKTPPACWAWTWRRWRPRRRARKLPAGLPCRFAQSVFLTAVPDGGPFQLVFGRGCFHVFDDPRDQAKAMDGLPSSARTQGRLGWRPTRPGLIADLEQGAYFQPPGA